MHCRICSRTRHGEPRAGIEVCGQQCHAVHSWRIRTHTHKPTRRSTVRGGHKGKSLKRGCCAVAAAARDEKRENYLWWRSRKRENYAWRKLSFVFRVFMGLVGSSGLESDPVVIYQFRDFEPPEHTPWTLARAHTCVQCSPGPPVCPVTESKRKDPRAEE